MKTRKSVGSVSHHDIRMSRKSDGYTWLYMRNWRCQARGSTVTLLTKKSTHYHSPPKPYYGEIVFSPCVALGPRFTLTGQGGVLLIIFTASAAAAAPAPPSSRDHHEREHDHVYWVLGFLLWPNPYQANIKSGSWSDHDFKKKGGIQPPQCADPSPASGMMNCESCCWMDVDQKWCVGHRFQVKDVYSRRFQNKHVEHTNCERNLYRFIWLSDW